MRTISQRDLALGVLLSIPIFAHAAAGESARFGVRGRGTGPYADLLARRFEAACQRLGLGRERVELDTTAFQKPGRGGRGGKDGASQLALF